MTSPVKGSSPRRQNVEAAYAEMEEKMRQQIKKLQEQRAAAMMNELMDLQKERDIALSRVKMLKKTVENLTVENGLLRSTIGQEKLAERFVMLEQSLLEEQLLTKDLQKKLHGVNKQNSTQELKIRKLELELATHRQRSPKTPTTAMIRLSVESDLARERSQSMNDLMAQDNDQDQQENNRLLKTQRSSSPHSGNGSVKRLKHKRISPPILTITSSTTSPLLNGHTSPGSPQTYSPTVIPRRYKLAAAVSRDATVQTDFANHQTPVMADDNEVSTKTELTQLQQEKQELEIRLSAETSKREKETERHKKLRKDCQVLQTECSVLRDSLSEFTRWVRQKVRLVEEDMDIFKVVYSLHGSLSQESEMLSHLQGKLTEAEQRVQHLEATNRILNAASIQAEEKYRHAQKQIALLKEKLSLLSPTSSPQKKRLSHSPKLRHRATPPMSVRTSLGKNARVSTNSPLLRTVSPLVSTGKVVVGDHEEGQKTNDVV